MEAIQSTPDHRAVNMVNIFGDTVMGRLDHQVREDFQDRPDPEALKEVKAILERRVLKKYIDGFQTW